MKFKNLKTGCVEIVTNKMVIEQYKKHTNQYVEVKESKAKKDSKETEK